MYKVLIVDDEILTAQFLQGLISWEKFGCEVVGMALTANQACRIAQEMQYVFLIVKTEEYYPLFPHTGNEQQSMIFANKNNFSGRKEMSLLEISQLNENTYGFLYELPPQISAKLVQERIMDNIRDVKEKIDTALSGKCSIVTTDPFSESRKLLYIRLKSVLTEVMLHYSGVLTEKEYFDLPLVKPVFPENFVDTVLGYIQMRNPKVSELICEPFISMPGQGRCLLEDLSPIAVLLESFGQMYANLKKPFLQQNQTNENQPIKMIRSLTMLIQWISGQADELIHIEENLYSKNHNIAKETAKYIENNYSRDISTDSIAEYLHISNGYLRSIFKKEFDCTVSEYLVKIRLDTAKHLLLEKEKKIYEIAALCGFQTSQYFSATFKAIVGVSPKDFKYGAKGGVVK